MTNRVELDLTSENNARYAVLVNALAEYAGTLEHQAEGEDQSDTYNGREPGGPSATRCRADAAIARQLVDEIEHQLDA